MPQNHPNSRPRFVRAVDIVPPVAIGAAAFVLAFVGNFDTMIHTAGQPNELAWLGPTAVELLLVYGLVSTVRLRDACFRQRAFAWFVVVVSAPLSVAGQILHANALRLSAAGIAINALWPVLLIFATELLIIQWRHRYAPKDKPADKPPAAVVNLAEAREGAGRLVRRQMFSDRALLLEAARTNRVVSPPARRAIVRDIPPPAAEPATDPAERKAGKQWRKLTNDQRAYIRRELGTDPEPKLVTLMAESFGVTPRTIRRTIQTPADQGDTGEHSHSLAHADPRVLDQPNMGPAPAPQVEVVNDGAEATSPDTEPTIEAGENRQ